MIEVHDLTKKYGTTRAVNGLSFSVRPGVVTGFLGPNGAGKSTTMRMILGLDAPTSGRATIDGADYRELRNPLHKVGALLDANWVHPNRSARSHLKWMARSNSLPVSRVQEVLELVGLSQVADKKAGQFSLGMKQRLGLASALLGDPEILLFDEPVNGLDPEGIYWMRTLMRRLASEGRAVLVSSHLLAEMAQTADHLVVIGRGKLIADSTTNDFIAAATRSTVHVRSPQLPDLVSLLQTNFGATVEPVDRHADTAAVSGVEIEKIGHAAAEASIVLYELSPQNGSLEQAFMQLTGEATEFAAQLSPDGPPVIPDPNATIGAAEPSAAGPAVIEGK